MSETPKTLVKLGTEDAERMRRLTAEVQDRLEELAQIAAAALGRTLESDDVRKFVPVQRAKQFEAAPATDDSTVLIEITGESGGTATCTIFCPPPASEVFVERPCGSTGFQCP
jgi:hypothetical protein